MSVSHSSLANMASRISSTRIVGLNWNKMESPRKIITRKSVKKNNKENHKFDNVTHESDNIEEKKRESIKSLANKRAKVFGDRILKGIYDAETATNAALTKRANVVKSAITSLKQKLKSSTKKRKRLVTATPSPFKADLIRSTPESTTRSGKVRMYSPFGFDSPLYTRTPQPKMGVGNNNKRLLLGSPDTLGSSLANDLEAQVNLSDWSTPGTTKRLTRSKIRTTPKSVRRSMRSRKPLFV